MASAEGAALITRPVDAWVGMRSSDAVAVGALGAGAAAVAGAGAGCTAGVGETGSGDDAGAGGGVVFATGGCRADGGASLAGPCRGATCAGVSGAATGPGRGTRPVAEGKPVGGVGTADAGRGFAAEEAGGAGEAGGEGGADGQSVENDSGRGIWGNPY